jgi:2-polyprenyl-6-methoxyphenol hydroxylase-like FAD-dependent oxidoreductase
MASYDAVIVGGRCAGATLAIRLARAGWRVLMLDEDQRGSDTLSTHYMFPNALARLADLGVWERLTAKHDVPFVRHRVQILGHEVIGTYTAVGGFDRGACIRRTALDAALVDVAIEAGAEVRFSTPVEGLVGAGTEQDPVRGVVLRDGETIHARWVLGADGRASAVAAALRLEKERRMAGELSFLFSYWRGIPPSECFHLVMEERLGMNRVSCEDGVTMLIVNGPADLTRGGAGAREQRYLDGLRRFPSTLDPAELAGAERITEIRAAPETMLRGFYRRPTGPGWALVGDACHFKHPATAQGIADAFEQAVHVADALAGEDPELAGYERWRDERAADHYEFSFTFAMLPRPESAAPLFSGLASDDRAAQDFLDVFTRRLRPREAWTAERLQRWYSSPR